MYKKIQLLTYSKTTEKIKWILWHIEKLKTNVRKFEELQGPTKTKKITVKKQEVPRKKNFLTYERVTNGVDVYHKFYEYMNKTTVRKSE